MKTTFTSFFVCLAAQSIHADDLPTAVPESVGVSSEALAELSDWVMQEELDVRSMILLRDGKMVLEWYSGGVTRDHHHNIFSVTKSVVSLLAGIAIDQELLAGTDATVGELFSEADDSAIAEVTLENLLTMRSGLPETRGNAISGPEKELFDELHESRDRLKSILGLPLIGRPGGNFVYGNIEPQLVLSAVERAAGEDGFSYARSHLFEKLAFENEQWLFPDRTGAMSGGYGLRLRAVDMAKLGQLMLQDGEWQGEQVVSNEWVEASTMNQTGSGYGYFWWMVRVPKGGRTFAAKGVRGQQILVSPNLKLVFVVTADLPPAQVRAILGDLNERMLRAVEENGAAMAENPTSTQRLQQSLSSAQNYLPVNRKALPSTRRPELSD